MRILAAIVALAIFAPSADAAIITTTKVKKLPVLSNLEIGETSFGFDIANMPSPAKYDAWVGVTNKRGTLKEHWYVGSVSARRGQRAPRGASFKTDLMDLLRFQRKGAYTLTAYLCPTNMKRPNATGCPNASTQVEIAE